MTLTITVVQGEWEMDTIGEFGLGNRLSAEQQAALLLAEERRRRCGLPMPSWQKIAWNSW